MRHATSFANTTGAVMATRRADGAPQMSIVAANVDADGRVIVSTRRRR